MSNFDADMKRAEQRIVSQATEAIRSIGLELSADIVERAADRNEPGGSPVASGRFAGSMRVSINRIDSSVEPEDRSYKYPSPAVHKYNVNNLPRRTIRNVPISRIASTLRRFKLGDTIWISNSLPYGPKIEDARHSWQTPQGVFERTVRHTAAKFRNIKLRVFRV